MEAIDRQLALGRAPGLTAHALRTAVARQAGGPAAGLAGLLAERASALQQLGLPAATSAALAAPAEDRLAADRAWLEREHILLLDALDPHYPPLLAEIADAPALLYVRGELASLGAPQLAMVGSRSPTASGRRTAQAFAAFLAQAGLAITSGLAPGIDAASHEGALAAGGRTVAVLGHGLDRIYPREHAALAERISAHGALLSELPPGSAPLKPHFLRRNRLISALSLGTLVVEAGRYSGSLTTARLAGEQGREVFAIPGSIHNPLARGCHALIRNGATLVESGLDVLEELKFSKEIQGAGDAMLRRTEGAGTGGETAPHHSVTLDKEYKILLDALGFEPTGVEMLAERSGLSSQAVASMLLILELDGAVKLQSDGRYVRLGR